MRPRWIALIIAGAAASAAAFAFAQPPSRDWLIYNHSPSVPVGLYLRSDAPATRGALVTVRAVAVAPEAARARGFTEQRDRFLKRIAAQSGDRVCAEGAAISINGVIVAERRAHDSAGRTLPAWRGCRVLAADEVFLLGDADTSFDGRYWGPVSRHDIEGVWRPLF